jgi:NADH-quinone oxidoreductase subunit N
LHVSSKEAIAILPILTVTAASLVIMLATAFHRSHKLAFFLALGAEAVAIACIPLASSIAPHPVTSLLIVDPYSLFFTGLLLAGTFAITVLSYGYLEKQREEKEEFYILLLLATSGSLVLASSNHFLSFFLGLEILSVSLYIMIAYLGSRKQPLEAGLKYLILASASASFLLFGMALVYAETGTMDFSRLAARTSEPGLLLLSGFALIISGIGFKLALVPFHMWTPDVYQGAPAPVAAFIATVSKGAVFALLLRYFLETNAYASHSLFLILTVVAVASMTAGNLLALLQTNLKRLLAYSSIANLGYLLVAFLANQELAVPASAFFLTAYFLSILTAFGVITLLSSEEGDADSLDQYRSLFWRRPWLAAALTAALFSLAGIPLTAGFIGKFSILAAGIGSARWLLVIVLVITSAIGIYYYLRVIVAMFSSPAVAEWEISAPKPMVPWFGGLVIAGLMVLLIWFGVYPSSIMRIIRSAVL